jgi:flagellar motor switch protein FliN/FliY
MNSPRDAIKTWFFETLATRLASVYESMTGERPAIQWEPLTTPPSSLAPGTLRWRQDFRGGPIRELAAVWISAADVDWTEASKQVLLAAGISGGDDATLKSTFIETLGQVFSGIALDMGSRVGAEVACAGGGESSARAGDGPWARLQIRFGGAAVDFVAGVEQDLLDSFQIQEGPMEQAPRLPAEANAAEASAANASAATPVSTGSKTFELLLDVELPVSISFGRAQVPLKDVLKLTTGSIVELNRSIVEPVEVIVNNCVIARGEVVVVEGNFGVRIHEVISRQERLRTLS